MPKTSNTPVMDEEILADNIQCSLEKLVPDFEGEVHGGAFALAMAREIMPAIQDAPKREVGKAKRIKFSLEYLHNMLDRRLSHESEAAAAWCDDLLDHVKALQQIYEIEGQNT